ncbi:MAG: amidohydrolase family protein, partial [Candidatus Eisenbacteria bacterium]|nr:amidohydrolase family protein [Candidatus Eisenbacteria bacterium]
GGARALGWDDEIGSLDPGRRADCVVLWPWGDPREHPDPCATVVQQGSPERVRRVYAAGRLLRDESGFTTIKIEDAVARAHAERRALLRRLGWPPSPVPLRPRWGWPEVNRTF